MRRRALLAALPTVLAGCSVAPAGPSTAAYSATEPNIFTSMKWDSDRSALLVEFTKGNVLTTENTGMLAVTTLIDGLNRTVWVASDEAQVSEDPVATFPLSPGATLIHEMPEPAQTRLVWVAPNRNQSRAVALWSPDSEPTATPTATPQSGGGTE